MDTNHQEHGREGKIAGTTDGFIFHQYHPGAWRTAAGAGGALFKEGKQEQFEDLGMNGGRRQDRSKGCQL